MCAAEFHSWQIYSNTWNLSKNVLKDVFLGYLMAMGLLASLLGLSPHPRQRLFTFCLSGFCHKAHKCFSLDKRTCTRPHTHTYTGRQTLTHTPSPQSGNTFNAQESYRTIYLKHCLTNCLHSLCCCFFLFLVCVYRTFLSFCPKSRQSRHFFFFPDFFF